MQHMHYFLLSKDCTSDAALAIVAQSGQKPKVGQPSSRLNNVVVSQFCYL